MSETQLIVALDLDTVEEASQIVSQLSSEVGWFKIGKELFTAAGPSSVDRFRCFTDGIFLDLKFHDIPNTVAGAVASATHLGAGMINMHALGGLKMMSAARMAADQKSSELGISTPKLLGVTVLTSIDEYSFQRDFDTRRTLKDQVAYLAELSQKAGLDGVVASPLEIELIRDVCGENFLIVTPGIRPKWAAVGDQRRITTPAEAVTAGADYIVVGRPITCADVPLQAVQEILREMGDASRKMHGACAILKGV